MTEYNTVQKWFHWITVGLLLVALPVGFAIKFILAPEDAILNGAEPAAAAFQASANAIKSAAYAIHQSAGLLLFAVVLLRLAWRLTHPVPRPAPGMPAVLHTLATAVHHTLYALLLAQATLGFVATNAWGFPLQGDTAFLRLIDLPKFMEANEGLAETLQGLHTLGGYAILGLVTLHVGGAIFHQAIRRDGTLLRMI